MENKFKDVLRALRGERCVGQELLAKEVGVSKGIVSMWENGLREPNMDSLIKLADYFGVSIDYLVGRTNKR